jgi:endonuclease I
MRSFLATGILILSLNVAYGQPPAGYYDATNGLNCQPLKTALKNIISNGQVALIYGQLDDIQMPVTDTIRNDAGNGFITWCLYSVNNSGPEPFTFSMAQSAAGGFCGSTTPANEGSCWNKEHTFPRAWFKNSDGSYPSPTQADLFNVRPADSKLNSRRANHPYADISSPTFQFPTPGQYPGYPMPPNPVLDKLGPASNASLNIALAWEPPAAVKGDIARGYFYMVTRYEDQLAGWYSTNPSSGIEKVIDNTNSIYPSLLVPYLTMLYNWHLSDPVDARESRRNELVYSQQNNRNPYIDHPEYVERVFQCTGIIPVTITGFWADLRSKDVQLTWEATHETSFKEYQVEKSPDGRNFSKIGVVAGTNAPSYIFRDSDLPGGGNIYYRLRMVDIDGKAQYSEIVTVKISGKISNCFVYPNPTNGSISIRLNSILAENSTVRIFDLAGRQVRVAQAAAGLAKIDLNVQSLSPGRYVVKLSNNRQEFTENFIIIK